MLNVDQSSPRAGYFGDYGGRFVPDTLMAPLLDLETIHGKIQDDLLFQTELDHLLKTFVGRPTPLTFASNLTNYAGGARIYLKREDLAHLGAHKINNALGQALLAKKSGKTRVIAETGAGQHGVATSAAAALLGLNCTVYMGERDIERQSSNVARMKLFGAEVISVSSGSRTLKDAINEAMRDWVTHFDKSHYLIGSVLGPHPYPTLVRNFQSVIGHEARRQILEIEGRLPDELIACVGGGSNAIGLFHAFQEDSVDFTGVEAGGRGVSSGYHASRFEGGSLGVLHGTKSYLLQDEGGQVRESHSISAGLDYPSIGPEHAHFREIGRAKYRSINDDEALAAFRFLALKEGIIPALESAHAVAYAVNAARLRKSSEIIIVNLSGRGDKDLTQVEALIHEESLIQENPNQKKGARS